MKDLPFAVPLKNKMAYTIVLTFVKKDVEGA